MHKLSFWSDEVNDQVTDRTMVYAALMVDFLSEFFKYGCGLDDIRVAVDGLIEAKKNDSMFKMTPEYRQTIIDRIVDNLIEDTEHLNGGF